MAEELLEGLSVELSVDLSVELTEGPTDELAGSGAGAEGGAIKVLAELVSGRLGHGKILQLQSTLKP